MILLSAALATLDQPTGVHKYYLENPRNSIFKIVCCGEWRDEILLRMKQMALPLMCLGRAVMA